MHQRLFYVTSKGNSRIPKKTPENVIVEFNKYMSTFRVDDEYDEAIPNNAFFDWYVIGGRWSGELSVIDLNNDKVEKFYEEIKIIWGDTDTEEKQHLKYKKIFKKYFPKYKGIPPFPFMRDSYTVNGYADDVKIVTKDIYEKLLVKCDEGDEGIIFSKDVKDKSNLIGKTYVVVVDYHI